MASLHLGWSAWLAPSPEFAAILSCSEARRAAFGMARTPAAPLWCFPHGRQHSLPYAFLLFYDALRAQALAGPLPSPGQGAGATLRAGVPPRRTGHPVQEVQKTSEAVGPQPRQRTLKPRKDYCGSPLATRHAFEHGVVAVVEPLPSRDLQQIGFVLHHCVELLADYARRSRDHCHR